MMLYRRHLAGESIEELAQGTGIPTERVRQRIDAVALHLEGQDRQAGVVALKPRFERDL